MMRRHNRNPARRDPYPPPRRVSTEEAFFDFVAQRPLPPKLAQRRLQRLQEEEEIYENQHGESHTTQEEEEEEQQQQEQHQRLLLQQQQSRQVSRVLLGSVPLSRPTPPTSASHQTRSLLAPTPGFLTPSDQGSSRALDASARGSGQNFLALNPFSPTNASLPSPASPSEAPATLSPDTHPAPLNLGSLAIGQGESAHAGPSSTPPTPFLSSSVGSQAATSQAPAPAPASWQAGFFIIGQDLVAQRWDVTVHFQLETSAISRRVVQHHGFRLERGPPSWINWTIQTPGGLVQPEYFVRGVTLMSTSTWLPIEPMSADFIVLDLEWTGGDVVLARPILSRILNRT